ncbi:MAG: hypothetical protein IJ615_05345 [Bacteroidaceae bacterium]|nr:hypothetical protein [Bacteroidaceae bacterium]
MKKMSKIKSFILLLVMFTLTGSLLAEDVVQVKPFTTTPGISIDDEETFSMELVNTNAYTALEFHLFLPEGITLDMDYPFDMNSDRFPGKFKKGVFIPNHDYDITNPTPGQYYVKIYNTSLETIEGTEGEILSFYYETSAEMKPGLYPIRVTGTVLAIDSHNGVEPAPSVSFVKITDSEGNVPANALLDLGNDEIPSFVRTELPEKNVIINGVCENLVLTDGEDFEVATAFTATQANFTTNVSGYKTLVLPFEADVPDGFSASKAISVTGTSINLESASTIDANSPVVIHGEGSLVLTQENAVLAATDDANLTSGVLSGTFKSIPAPVGSYVLQKQNGLIGFYLVADVQPTVGAFRALLYVPDSGVKVYTIADDATGISFSSALEEGNEYYNMSGQRVGKAQKGINIVKRSSANAIGKKILY